MLTQHIRFIEKYDKNLAQLISNYGPYKKKEKEVLNFLFETIKDQSKLLANIDILLENAEKIEDRELKSKIKNRLILIQRYFNEVSALNHDIEDINYWGSHVHYDISFFTDRIQTYFKGGITEDRYQFTALNSFNDESLKKTVLESKEVRIIYYLAQYTRNIDAQLNFISDKISFLQTDIEGRIWVRNIATKEFYNNIDEYADKFRAEFKNNPFADLLNANKSKIVEQPFAWIDLLSKMKSLLEQLMSKKISAIDNAENFILYNFRKRAGELEAAIQRLALQLNEILLKGIRETEDINLIREIDKGINRLEITINRFWKRRKKKFKYLKNKIPKVNEFLEKIDLIPEADKVAQSSKSFVQFSDHSNKVISSIKNLSSREIPLILKLAYDYARMGDIAVSLNLLEKVIKEKDNSVKSYNFNEIKNSLKELIALYMQFINFVRLTIDIKIDSIVEKLYKFERDYYRELDLKQIKPIV